MAASGILPALLPGALQLARLEQLIHVDAENLFPSDAVLRLAALCPMMGETARAVGEALKLSNADRARLEDLSAADEKIVSHLSARTCAGCSIVSARRASRIGCGCAGRRTARAPRCCNGACCCRWRIAGRGRAFPLTGRDVMAAGVPEGPAVGRILGEIEKAWIESDFAEDEAAAGAKTDGGREGRYRMTFQLLDVLSLAGDIAKPNEDAFAHSENAALVLDGATPLGSSLLPVPATPPGSPSSGRGG